MSQATITDCITTTARQFNISNFAVGMWVNEREIAACFRVTSIANPLPIDQDTVVTLGQAIPSLLLEPLRKNHSFYERYDPALTSA